MGTCGVGMNAEKILQIVIGIVLIAGVIFMIRCYSDQKKAEKEQLKQQVVDRLGEVDIDPRATFGEVKRIFGVEPEMKLWGTNAVAAAFGSDYGTPLVQFVFFEPDNKIESVTDKDLPARIEIHQPFRGSICGVHIGDALDAAEVSIGRCFPLVKRRLEQDEGWSLELNASFTLSKSRLLNSDSLYFADKAYETKVRMVPNFGSSENK